MTQSALRKGIKYRSKLTPKFEKLHVYQVCQPGVPPVARYNINYTLERNPYQRILTGVQYRGLRIYAQMSRLTNLAAWAKLTSRD